MSEENLLDVLLSTAANELEKNHDTTKILKETNIFDKESNITGEKVTKVIENKGKLSIIHGGDTDSSDDEDNKYHEEQRYNQYGREIKHLLDSESSSSRNFTNYSSTLWNQNQKVEVGSKSNTTTLIKSTKEVNTTAHTDPVFGLRIVNPVVSFSALQDRMIGRETVSFSKIKKFVCSNVTDKNWVIAGVIVNKSSVKTSQKGNQFLIWSLSDLKDEIKTVSVFLFGSAYKQFWKTSTSTVVGILNPSVLDKKDGSKDEACLSVDNAQKIMIMGKSKDLGTCKSIKKNGEKCTAIVNISKCEFCIYHIKQEYQKCSRRSELQSNFSGKGLTALRNKVLGKNEVFYAGKSYMAIPAKRSKKLELKDKNRLHSLSGSLSNLESVKMKNHPKKKQVAANLDISHRQRLKDLELLEKLGGINETKTTFTASHSAEVTLESSKNIAASVIAKLKSSTLENDTIELTDKPLSVPLNNNLLNKKKHSQLTHLKERQEKIIDLSSTITPQQINRAKLNALKYIQKNGPLEKEDPNSIKKRSGVKKPASEEIENDPKRRKIAENNVLSDRFKKMMEASSKHTDLLDDKDDEEQEKYFKKLESKEKMEEKMINTFKVPCKAVQCLKCKYTHFSASQKCKDEKHPLRVFDTVKRFFKCNNCGNRTQCLDVVPTYSCKNCGSGKWERTGMMKDKTASVTTMLSIRGGEQKFVNSVITDANINLLIPDEQ